MSTSALLRHIEGVLFYRSGPVEKKFLCTFFSIEPDELSKELGVLAERLQDSALTLVETSATVELTTTPELSDTIEKLVKDDFSRDIGKAGAETLAVILYRGPVTRSEIDRIRGVNSSYILRSLLVRGLIEKQSTTAGSTVYQSTSELLKHLGIQEKKQLPEYDSILAALEAFENTSVGDT